MRLHLCLAISLLISMVSPALGATLPTARAAGAAREQVASAVQESPAEASGRRPIDSPVEAAPAVPEYRLGPSAEDRSGLWAGMRMALSLGAVLLLLGFGVKLLRRWQGGGVRGGSTRTLHVLERVALTPKDSICLVRAGGEVLAVGVSAAGITLLARLEGVLIDAGLPVSTRLASPALSGHPVAPGSRFRELAARLREVQAVWGLGGGGTGGQR